MVSADFRTTPRWQPGDYSHKEREAVESMAESLFAEYIQKQRIAADPVLALGLELGAIVSLATPRADVLTNVDINAPELVEIPAAPAILTTTIDPELLRLAIALKEAAPFRMWLILRHLVRAQGGSPKVTRAALVEALKAAGINADRQNVWRWSKAGKGRYWNLSADGNAFYLISYQRVAVALTASALARELPELIDTNKPGSRSMYVQLGGSHKQFEANGYAAWLAYRENPMISRANLAALFNRTPATLREWERLAGIGVNGNVAQYSAEHTAAVPEHGYAYTAIVSAGGQTETHWRARMVNAYHAPVIRQHHKRGQSRRVARLVREYLATVELIGTSAREDVKTTSDELNPIVRLYFREHKRAKQSAKLHGDRNRWVEMRPGVHDYTPDGRQYTTPNEHAPLNIQQQHLGYQCRPAKGTLYAA